MEEGSRWLVMFQIKKVANSDLLIGFQGFNYRPQLFTHDHLRLSFSLGYSSRLFLTLRSYFIKETDGSDLIVDDFREAYYWLRCNTPKDSRILSWWDYGYQIAGFSDRTTIVDNNTWNNTHIATVGKVMATGESTSYKVMPIGCQLRFSYFWSRFRILW